MEMEGESVRQDGSKGGDSGGGWGWGGAGPVALTAECLPSIQDLIPAPH